MARLSILLLLVGLALPSVGPLVDHHFAERHPDHRHLGVAGYHAHGLQHLHVRIPVEGTDSSGQSAALLNYESGPAATVVAVSDDKALQFFLLFEPASLFVLPLPPLAQPKYNYTVPPKKPPQQLL